MKAKDASGEDGIRLAVGFFDGVHLGHQRILAGANAVLTFRNHPASVLGVAGRPALLMEADERLALLATEGAKNPRTVHAITFTHRFAALSAEQFADFLRREFPNLVRIHCGGNWRFGANGAGTPAMLRALGFDVKVCRYAKYREERVSSTRIRAALASGEIADANAMLGRPYAVTGLIVSGKGLGHKIGSPTLNLTVSPPLKLGVYVVDTPLGCGIANYGVAPTMGIQAWAAPVLEVHLLDGRALAGASRPMSLRVAFRAFLRPEMAFASRSALSERIAADIAAARRFFGLSLEQMLAHGDGDGLNAVGYSEF